MAEFIPSLITSEVFPCEGIDRVIDARSLPFANGELRAVTMTNVLHHLPAPCCFLAELRVAFALTERLS